MNAWVAGLIADCSRICDQATGRRKWISQRVQTARGRHVLTLVSRMNLLLGRCIRYRPRARVVRHSVWARSSLGEGFAHRLGCPGDPGSGWAWLRTSLAGSSDMSSSSIPAATKAALGRNSLDSNASVRTVVVISSLISTTFPCSASAGRRTQRNNQKKRNRVKHLCSTNHSDPGRDFRRSKVS